MGNKPVKTKESIIFDRLILDSFKDSDLEIPVSDINKLKLHFKDAENYFGLKFDYLIYFNNKLFRDGLPVLYDNYISKVEQFSFKSKTSKKIFSVFIDFEQDFDFEEETELEFDPIFTVIFEKLEIKNILCFFLVNSEIEYLQIFFEQLYENVYLYKDSRNYDSLYFLLPNTDFFIKNEDYLLYISNQDKSGNKVKGHHLNTFKTCFNDILFNTNYFNKFLSLKSAPSYCSSKINTFIKNMPDILFIKYISEINIDDDDKLNFINKYKRFFDFHSLLCSKTANIQIIFRINSALNDDNIHNLTNLIKFVITNCQNSVYNNCLLVIKIISINENNNNSNNNNNNNVIENKPLVNHLSTLDKFIQMLLNISFVKDSKKYRKLIIDYYNIYRVTLPNNTSKNKNKYDNLSKNKDEVFINNLDEEGIEDSDAKENTIYNYNKEKLMYEWFIKDNLVRQLKINIIYIIDFKFNTYYILYSKLNKNKKDAYINREISAKIKKLIFSFIFPIKASKYYYSQYNKQVNLKNNEANFEKLIYI